MQEKEAEIFSKYLVKSSPSETLISRYVLACNKLKLAGNAKDEKIVSFAVRNPFFLPLLDAGLTFSKHKSLLRKKIMIMLAILETTPEYYEQFNTKNYSGVKWIGIFFRGCWAVAKMIMGKFILMFI
ncbi:MAG: hypothetical protein IAF38_02130 [Bacteroidia bacterium]|nr:hypothetical protein [Bacteroidia bacterium]